MARTARTKPEEARTRGAIGLIGYGRFGALLAELLQGIAHLRVYDRHWDPEGSGSVPAAPTLSTRVQPASLAETAGSRAVVFAVPIRALRDSLREAAPHMRPDAIVIDVSSVKIWPIRWMEELCPPDAEIVGTHPFFGPDSFEKADRGEALESDAFGEAPAREAASRTATSATVALVLARVRHRRLVHRILRRLGLDAVECTADEHDRQAARSLALPHWIGRLCEASGFESQTFETVGYRDLLDLRIRTGRDSRELFEDIHRWNPYATEERTRWMTAAHELESELAARSEPRSDTEESPA